MGMGEHGRGRFRFLLGCLLIAGLAPSARAQESYPAWDRLFLKPELPIAAPLDKGKLTLLVYHSYPNALHRLRIAAKGELLEQDGPPIELAQVLPTEIVSVKIPLRRRGRPTSDTTALKITFTAAELNKPGETTLTMPLTAKGERAVMQQMAMPVGEVALYVTRVARSVYTLQVLGVIVLMVWLFWRKRGVNRLAPR
jgi:hypothetical protein